MPVIIDGHNLLHSIQKVGDYPQSISDVGLCQIISRYLTRIGEKGEVIFDGTGPPDKSGFDDLNNLEVFFAGLHSDADTIIENKIKASSAPKRLTIVSSDRRVAAAGRARKTTVVKSPAFWENVRKQLSRKPRPKEPNGKRRGLTESETEQWMDFFGIEQ